MRFTLLFACSVAIGCGSSSPFDYVKVSGKITYDDGTAIPGSLRLKFVAEDAPTVEGAVPRPAFANVNDRGEFDCVTSYKYGDGLIPGRHKVAVEAGGKPDAKPRVPKEYLTIATTPLEVDTADAPFDIKVPKPKGTR